MVGKSRELWVDYIKVYACVLVAVGHFFQSMVSAGIIPHTSVYDWFDTTIYYYHVPLFFICSGYLHQKRSCINSFLGWKQHVLKKTLFLGIPYFVFSLVTWVLKTVFSGVVNNQSAGLLQSLIFDPMSPYWYLYALFFIAIIFLPFSNRKAMLIGCSTALMLKVLSAYIDNIQIYAVATVMDNAIWFVFGMLLCFVDVQNRFAENKWLWIGVICGIGFLAGSTVVQILKINMSLLPFFLGVLGCAATLFIVIHITGKGKQSMLMDVMSKYIMPIFLMHTIFAAGMRSVLLKMGIRDSTVHIILGLLISFVGPMISAEIMKLIKLDFLIYPGKYIKLYRKTEEKR